jgi:hypothetical protein
MEKRYVVYGWDEDAQKNYADDYNKDLTDALEEGRRDIIDYGEERGEFDNEDDACEGAIKYYDAHHMSYIISIYDREEKHWFN